MKLLVVDDAPYILKALRDLLEARGHVVYEANNGAEALTKFEEVKPDVVLMDILMPMMDGVSATRKILQIDPNARIIVITAVGKRGLENECIEAGAKCFVVKPFKTKDLLSAINVATTS